MLRQARVAYQGIASQFAKRSAFILGGAAVYRCDNPPTFSRGFSRRGHPFDFFRSLLNVEPIETLIIYTLDIYTLNQGVIHTYLI
jgi:hypothetical protein